MAEPKLRVRASGYGGSGYLIPTWLDDDGKPTKVPGVTTVLGALAKPGIPQWVADNTAAFAVAMAPELLRKSDEQAFNLLRWYHTRNPDFDDPTVDLRNYSNGVLNDLANLGTITHDWIEARVWDDFEPALIRWEQEQMAEQFVTWLEANDVQPVVSEVTVVNTGTHDAGTLDHIWIINGVPTLVDVKTSRNTHLTHVAQLAALSASNVMMREHATAVPGSAEYKTKKHGTTHWTEDVLPSFSQHAILRVRPDDVNHKGEFVPAYCKLDIIPQWKVDTAYEIYLGALRVKHAENRIKTLEKEHADDL